jgi:hypothetical protein
LGAYRDPDGRAFVYLSIVYADGREGAGEFQLDAGEFEELWAAVTADGVLELGDASPDYGGAPPPTDIVSFGVAARDGTRTNGFAARDPGSLSDPRYSRVVRRLDGLVRDYESRLEVK